MFGYNIIPLPDDMGKNTIASKVFESSASVTLYNPLKFHFISIMITIITNLYRIHI